jgi:hypothetical protein
MKDFGVGDKVYVDDGKEFYKSPGVIKQKISDTRYSVKVLVMRQGAKTKQSIRMRFNVAQLEKRKNATRV